MADLPSPSVEGGEPTTEAGRRYANQPPGSLDEWRIAILAIEAEARAGVASTEATVPPCVFPDCVSNDRHYHGGFPGGYENPADPDGPPILFTSEPAPGVRDYNGALLRASTEATLPFGEWTWLYEDYGSDFEDERPGTVFITDDPVGSQRSIVGGITPEFAALIVNAHNAVINGLLHGAAADSTEAMERPDLLRRLVEAWDAMSGKVRFRGTAPDSVDLGLAFDRIMDEARAALTGASPSDPSLCPRCGVTIADTGYYEDGQRCHGAAPEEER